MTSQTQAPVPVSWTADGTRAERRLRRTLATLAALSAVLHILLLGHGSLLLSGIMAGLAFWCLLCAGRLWRESSPRTLTMIAGMNTGMVVTHLWLMVGMGDHSAAGAGAVSVPSAHHGGTETTTSGVLPMEHPALMVAATLVALVEVIGALWLRRRWLQRGVVREGND